MGTALETASASLNGYQLRLPAFEGPLDVLLRLIERSHLQVIDVSLMAVTDQFLAYVDELGEARPDSIADFTGVASRLLLLKSRSLLPRPPAADDEEPIGDLARELIAYRAVKQAAQLLAERDRNGEGAFARGSAPHVKASLGAPPKLAAHEAAWLAGAIRRRLATIPTPQAILRARPMVSLREMVDRVLLTFSGRKRSTFATVAGQCRNHHEVRTAFLAVLVLIRRRLIDVDQDEPFGEITLSRTNTVHPSFGESLAFSADD